HTMRLNASSIAGPCLLCLAIKLLASTRKASSTKGSFSMAKAGKGVLALPRVTSQRSRLLASKMPSFGGGDVYFINVYSPFLYRSSPFPCRYTESSPLPDVDASHRPSG